MKKISIIFSFIIMLGFVACEYTDIIEDDGSGSVPESVSFSADIEPIFTTQSCTNCHPSMKKPDLSAGNAYESIMDLGLVNTSNPAESELYTKPSPDGSHGAKYTSAQAKLVLAWIEQGAKNN
ncbi:hypothetical protein ACE01N_03970 [Saccharicrinis sp. FJH2]|uniref:hypothetical protein n=1 Tax=Saccharicrinis sp. FJH65 TaxID=3344659 RepID=UPI0035F39034